MILTCPACSTRFLVPDAAFAGRASRRVRCGRCKHEWQAAAPLAAASTDFASLITETAPDLLAAAVPPQPIPAGSNLPVKIKRKWLGKLQPRRNTALLILALILALVALAAIAPAGLAWLQGTLGSAINKTLAMEQTPSLTIETVKTNYVLQTAAAAATGLTAPDALGAQTPAGYALVVEGKIVNQTDDEKSIPPLRLLTKDAQGALLGTYRPSVQAQTLPPHGETGFSMQLGAADPKLAEVTVQFVDE